MEQKDQTHFNETYYQNNGQSGDRPALKLYYNILRRYLTSGKVLEYGAGEGYLTKRIATTFSSYSYDISEYARKNIRKLSPSSTVFDKESEFPKDTMDGIICLHTLEHLKDPAATLKLFSSTLKKDGILLYVLPNVDGLGHKIKKDKWFGYRDVTHISLLKTEEWKRITKEAGFEIIKASSDGFWDVPYITGVPNIIQKLIFFPSAALLVFTNRLIYPEWFGEDLVVVAKKVR